MAKNMNIFLTKCDTGNMTKYRVEISIFVVLFVLEKYSFFFFLLLLLPTGLSHLVYHHSAFLMLLFELYMKHCFAQFGDVMCGDLA